MERSCPTSGPGVGEDPPFGRSPCEIGFDPRSWRANLFLSVHIIPLFAGAGCSPRSRSGVDTAEADAAQRATSLGDSVWTRARVRVVGSRKRGLGEVERLHCCHQCPDPRKSSCCLYTLRQQACGRPVSLGVWLGSLRTRKNHFRTPPCIRCWWMASALTDVSENLERCFFVLRCAQFVSWFVGFGGGRPGQIASLCNAAQ